MENTEHNLKIITEDEVRDSVLTWAKSFSEKNKMSLSAISKEAVGDSKFLSRVQRGYGFNIRTYAKVLGWLEEQERAGA